MIRDPDAIAAFQLRSRPTDPVNVHASDTAAPRSLGGRPFTLIEIVVAAGLFGMLLVCVHGSVNVIRNMEREFSAEHLAVTTLDNVLERVVAEQTGDPTLIRRLFEEEFQAGELNDRADVTTACDAAGDCLTLKISWQSSGKLLAQLRIPCDE